MSFHRAFQGDNLTIEAALLRAIANSSSEAEQARLVKQLDAFRAQRISERDADRSLDFSFKPEQTPIVGHAHSTISHSSDWILDLPTNSERNFDHKVRAEATLWFQKVSREVRADMEEFGEQAEGKADEVSGQYGAEAEEAHEAFLSQVARLYSQSSEVDLDDDEDEEGDDDPNPFYANRQARLAKTAVQIEWGFEDFGNSTITMGTDEEGNSYTVYEMNDGSWAYDIEGIPPGGYLTIDGFPSEDAAKKGAESGQRVNYASRSYKNCPECGSPAEDGECTECSWQEPTQGELDRVDLQGAKTSLRVRTLQDWKNAGFPLGQFLPQGEYEAIEATNQPDGGVFIDSPEGHEFYLRPGEFEVVGSKTAEFFGLINKDTGEYFRDTFDGGIAVTINESNAGRFNLPTAESLVDSVTNHMGGDWEIISLGSKTAQFRAMIRANGRQNFWQAFVSDDYHDLVAQIEAAHQQGKTEWRIETLGPSGRWENDGMAFIPFSSSNAPRPTASKTAAYSFTVQFDPTKNDVNSLRWDRELGQSVPVDNPGVMVCTYNDLADTERFRQEYMQKDDVLSVTEITTVARLNKSAVSQSDGEAVLAALLDQQGVYVEAGYSPPELLMDFDGRPTIMWEEGPYEWTMLFPHGGIDEEFGFKVKDVSDQIPASVFVEPINHYSVGLYEN